MLTVYHITNGVLVVLSSRGSLVISQLFSRYVVDELCQMPNIVWALPIPWNVLHHVWSLMCLLYDTLWAFLARQQLHHTRRLIDAAATTGVICVPAVAGSY